MKKYKTFIMGFFVGAVLMVTTSALAAGLITVTEDNSVMFNFNGIVKRASEEYSVLFYKDHVYVPIRYVGEELGAVVDWDSVNRHVIFNTIGNRPQDITVKETTSTETTTETTTEATTETTTEATTETTTQTNYRYMPVEYRSSDFRLTLLEVMTYPHQSSIVFEIENRIDTPIQVSPTRVKVTVDGKDVPVSRNTDDMDMKLFSDIRKDDRFESYIPIEKLNEDAKHMTVEFEVFYNDPIAASKTKTITFDVRLD